MPLYKQTPARRTKIAPPPSVNMQACMSRGLDLDYVVKRMSDGEVVVKLPEKGAAKHRAEQLGYVFKY